MIHELLSSKYFALFLIITIGIIIGRISIKGISLDASAVIFVALVFGHFNVQVPEIFQTIGLLLFIYSVGIQAGPGFFSSFKNNGLKAIIVAVVLVVTGALTAVAFTYIFSIDIKIAVGLFTGALTSTPGLAAAIESTQSDMASIGYGIAYPFGVVGVILFIHLIPRILKIDITEEERNYELEQKADFPALYHKQYIVENINIAGKSIAELSIRTMTEANVSRILHDNKTIIPTGKTILENGDIIRAVGSLEALKLVELLIGRETTDDIPLHNKSDIRWVLVSNKKVVNKTLAQINLFKNYDATVTRIRRSGVDITPKPSSQLRFGDKLLVACQGDFQSVTKLLGNDDKKLSETDFLPIAFGLVIGIIIGKIEFPLFGHLPFKLGLTGGVLTTALILSRLGKTGKILWNISGSANQLLRQLGLLFFLASVGTKAGSTIVETIKAQGATIFVAGIFITLIPMIVAILIGRFFFKANFLSLLGTITGGMTSTPGLTAADSLADSNASNIAYATVYPFAMVVLIICTQVMSML